MSKQEIKNDSDLITFLNLIYEKGTAEEVTIYLEFLEFLKKDKNNFGRNLQSGILEILDDKYSDITDQSIFKAKRDNNKALMSKIAKYLYKPYIIDNNIIDKYIEILKKYKNNIPESPVTPSTESITTPQPQPQPIKEESNIVSHCTITNQEDVSGAINCICEITDSNLKQKYIDFLKTVKESIGGRKTPTDIYNESYNTLDEKICEIIYLNAPLEENEDYYNNIINEITSCLQSTTSEETKEEPDQIVISNTTDEKENVIKATVIPAQVKEETIKGTLTYTTKPSITPAIAVAIAASQPPPPVPKKQVQEQKDGPAGEEEQKDGPEDDQEVEEQKQEGPDKQSTKVLSNDAVTYITPQGLVYIYDKKTNEITEYEG
jgi:type IV secretory pathway VirB10-like protein